MQVPINVYRLRPLNTTNAVVLDSNFSRLQIWDMEGGILMADQPLERPAKEIAVEGNIVSTIEKFNGFSDK